MKNATILWTPFMDGPISQGCNYYTHQYSLQAGQSPSSEGKHKTHNNVDNIPAVESSLHDSLAMPVSKHWQPGD